MSHKFTPSQVELLWRHKTYYDFGASVKPPEFDTWKSMYSHLRQVNSNFIVINMGHDVTRYQISNTFKISNGKLINKINTKFELVAAIDISCSCTKNGKFAEKFSDHENLYDSFESEHFRFIPNDNTAETSDKFLGRNFRFDATSFKIIPKSNEYLITDFVVVYESILITRVLGRDDILVVFGDMEYIEDFDKEFEFGCKVISNEHVAHMGINVICLKLEGHIRKIYDNIIILEDGTIIKCFSNDIVLPKLCVPMGKVSKDMMSYTPLNERVFYFNDKHTVDIRMYDISKKEFVSKKVTIDDVDIVNMVFIQVENTLECYCNYVDNDEKYCYRFTVNLNTYTCSELYKITGTAVLINVESGDFILRPRINIYLNGFNDFTIIDTSDTTVGTDWLQLPQPINFKTLEHRDWAKMAKIDPHKICNMYDYDDEFNGGDYIVRILTKN